MENYKIFIFNKFLIKFRDDILKYITLFILLFGVILVFTFSIFNYADAATNIDSTYRYAWNDVIGWIDFYQTGNVNVTSTQLIGYATSSVGFIALDCATSPNADICATSNFKVSNDGSGNLTGWAYNDAIGWISFDSGTATSSYAYQVTVNNSTGDFSGWAWNDIVGWISFNCLQPDICATSNYKVKTSWTTTPATATLTSSVFDTGVLTGVAINTIMWQGSQPTGTSVKFQIASSNSTSTWTYLGPGGSSVQSDVYQPISYNVPSQINLAYHNNHRYFRYKIFLESNAGQTLSPRVDDVIINWSP